MVLDSWGDLHHFSRFWNYQALPTKVAPWAEIWGEQGPKSHLKKWNSGVWLEQDVWQIAVPCKHQDNGTTEPHHVWAQCSRRAFQWSKRDTEGPLGWGGGAAEAGGGTAHLHLREGPTGLGQPPTAGALLPILIHSKSILFARTARLLQSPLLPFHAIK